MPSLKAIRKRISSVRSTQQITKAMKMVSAAKLRRAQEAVTALKKYEQELYSFVESKHPEIFADILKKRELDNDLRAKMNKALEEFKGTFKA